MKRNNGRKTRMKRQVAVEILMSHLTLLLFDIDSGLFIVEIHNC